MSNQQTNRDNFYTWTSADFRYRKTRPSRRPDYVSKSGSAYWFTVRGVVRGSDHWGYVASCDWMLIGSPTGIDEVYRWWKGLRRARVMYGFSPWRAFIMRGSN